MISFVNILSVRIRSVKTLLIISIQYGWNAVEKRLISLKDAVSEIKLDDDPAIRINSLRFHSLKGHCREFFYFRFFLWIIFSRAPADTNRFRFFSKIREDIQQGALQCQRHKWQVDLLCRWHQWYALTCGYLRGFSKNWNGSYIIIRGPWKMIHEKTWS